MDRHCVTLMRVLRHGMVAFGSLGLTANFPDGDVVRPMLSGTLGRALGHALTPASDGRGFASTPGEPVAQAMLLVNPHEARSAGTDV